jgi:HEAT repeat protein
MGLSRRLIVVPAVGVLVMGAFAGCRSRTKTPDLASLVRDLQSPDSTVSGRANLALISVGEPAVPAIAQLLGSEDARIRRTAATTLWGMGPKARSAVPALSTTLGDADRSIRVASARALESMGPEARAALPALVRGLQDGDTEVRQWSAKALGAIGPDAAEALPALVRAAKFDPVRPAAEEAIQKIQGP